MDYLPEQSVAHVEKWPLVEVQLPTPSVGHISASHLTYEFF